jgi:serine/threonine-protein kinase
MGGVIYEATTGHQPFEANADLEVMTKIVEGRITPPSAYVPNFPRELESILYRSMANDPGQRFSTADEMRLALESWLARSGPPVTHVEVAALLRSRVGGKMDERLGRIRAAMTAGPQHHPSHTPSGAGISTSGVIPTNRPARVAPIPPGLPQPVPPPRSSQPNALQPPPRRAPPSQPVQPPPSRRGFASDPSDLAPDSGSGFNMDTVADFYLPDYLDPNAPMVRPEPGTPPPPPARAVASQPASPVFQAPHAMYAPQPEEPPIDVRQYILAAIIGVGVAVALGGAGLFVWHLISPDPPAPIAAPAAPRPARSP